MASIAEAFFFSLLFLRLFYVCQRQRKGRSEKREGEREKSVQSGDGAPRSDGNTIAIPWAVAGPDLRSAGAPVATTCMGLQGLSRGHKRLDRADPGQAEVSILSQGLSGCCLDFFFLPRAVNVNMYVSRADGAAAVVGRHRGVTLEGWMLGNLGFGGGPAGVPSVPFGPSHSGGGCPESCPALCLVSAAPPLAVRGFPHPLRTGPGHGVRGASEARDRPFHRPEAPPYRPRPPSRLARPTGCHRWALHSGVPFQDPHPRATG